MNCKKAQELISMHIDNKLSLQEVNELNMHLSSCDKCMKNYNELKNIKSLLSRKNNIKLSANFTKSTMDKIYSIKYSQPKVISFNFSKKYFAMAASFLFILCASTYYVMTNKSVDFDSTAIFEACNQTEYDMEHIYEGDITSFLL